MQEELNQFEKKEVLELVTRLSKQTIIVTKLNEFLKIK